MEEDPGQKERKKDVSKYFNVIAGGEGKTLH